MKVLKDKIREWKKQSKQVNKNHKKKRNEKLGIRGPRYEHRRGAWIQK